ncbi:MAG: hypothetical protein J6X60_11665 [Ruminiclostridium sp.]|nr:hypothetical protein [Ruminiclostridium sp.]
MDGKSDKFSRIGFCCVLYENMKIAWSNEPALFRKMISSRSCSAAFRAASVVHASFEHRMTFEGVRFRIIFLPMPDSRYLCTAYPEELYIRFAYSKMYMRIFNIRRVALNSISLITELKGFLAGYDLPDEAFDKIGVILGLSEDIMNDSSRIASLFDSEHINEYVLISDKIKASYDQVRKYNISLDKNIEFRINIGHSVARINYTVFETILFEIVRIMFLSLPDKGSCVLRIYEKDIDTLSLTAEIALRDSFSPGTIEFDVRDINCACEFLGGISKIYLKDDVLAVRVDIPVSLSNFVSRVNRFTSVTSSDGEPVEELKGYERVIVPGRRHISTEYELQSPKKEWKLVFSDFLSSVMFDPLVPGYESFND